MERVIVGRLAGVEESKLSIQLNSGEVKVFPRKELDVSLQWVFENMGHTVMLAVSDGVVTGVRSMGMRVGS